MRKAPRPTHPRGRPSPPPPPLTRSPDEPALPHAVVLDENESAPAVVLWQTLRDVTLWASLPPDRRGPGLFNDEAGDMGDAIPELRLDLATLGALVRDPHPDCAPIIASICQRVAAWAEERERMGTALAYAQAAALVDLARPSAALGVARLARNRADYARAVVWYRRAMVLARRAGDWQVQAPAFPGVGNLHRQRGDLVRAGECHQRSLRLALRFGLRDVRGGTASVSWRETRCWTSACCASRKERAMPGSRSHGRLSRCTDPDTRRSGGSRTTWRST